MNPTLLDFDIAFADADLDLDRVFVVSDPHFGHANIIKYCRRPFADADEMDRQLIARWNATVPPDATVWLLGDVTVKPEKLGPLLRQLNGRKLLVAGNHDQPHPVSLSNKGRQPEELAGYARAYRAAGFDAVHLGGAFTLPDFGRVLVCHYPYSNGPDHLRVRFPDDGETPLLHGHVHDKWRFKGRMLNVGVEVQDYRPVSLRDIRDLFRAERAAGWPTLGEPEDEKMPNAPATPELPPNERMHFRRWFVLADGGLPPDLPGAGQRTTTVDGTTLLEVWIDGSNPDAELLWRRCYLSPALTLAAIQMISPIPWGGSVRLSAEERVAQSAVPYFNESCQMIEFPPFETPTVLKWLATAFSPAEPEPLTDGGRVGTQWRFAGANGREVIVQRLHRLDADGRKVGNSELATLYPWFPKGTPPDAAMIETILLHRRLPFRDPKSVTLYEPA